MSKINITYPTENYILYGDTLNLKYNIVNQNKKDNIKYLILDLSDGRSFKVDINVNSTKYSISGLISGDYIITGYLQTINGVKYPSSDFTLNFKTITEKFTPPNLNWFSIKETLPEFIKEDYKTFTSFIDAYYEWLQTSNNPLYAIYNSEAYPDIDKTPQIFLDRFRTQYLNDFPTHILDVDNINLRNIIKNIKQFYQSKGTDKSFKFLFRLLYNTYVELYHPRKDLLVASGDLWVENTLLRIRGITWEQGNKIKNSLIYQKQYNEQTKKYEIISSARIVDVKSYKINNNEEVFELIVDNITGVFNKYNAEQSLTDYLNGYVGEKVFVDILDGKTVIPYEVYMINGISKIKITNTGLTIGDYIEVHSTGTSTGSLFSAVVKNIDSKGIPTEFTILNHGYDYRGSEFNTYKKNSDNTLVGPLNATIEIKKLLTESGYYRTKKSAPSSGGIIRDNRKYQESSYVIKTDMRIEEYIDAVKKLVHPAGIGVFDDFLVLNSDEINISNKTIVNKYVRPYIGNYLPYTLMTFKNLRNDKYPFANINLYPDGLKDLYPHGFDPNSQIPDQITAETAHLVEYANVIRTNIKDTKFTFLPPVSDIANVYDYWVVYPHPNTSNGILNTDKRIMDLTIQEFTTLFAETIVI